MKYFYFLMLISLCNLTGFAQQNVKVITPQIGFVPKLDTHAQNQINRRDALLSKKQLTASEQKELDKLFEEFDETKESVWDVVSGGCSWYCGGGPYKITASSSLKTQGSTTYEAENAHDFSFKTAWVEGVKGYGIGEYLEYYFENASPRITEIKIFNGYVKTDNAWSENSRVKKFELSINGVPYAILNLQDSKAQQNFKVTPLGHRADKKDLILKFKILDVYPGTKYDDVAITEIYFDGTDVHCLGKGTKVLLSNNYTKNIEDLLVGDTIKTLELNNEKFSIGIIEKMEVIRHSNLVKYVFDEGITIVSTQDHPFMLLEKGWSSLLPENSTQYKGFDKIEKIEIGDFFKLIDSNGKPAPVKLLNIEYLFESQETYTISKLSSGNNFIANGLVVAIEELAE